MEYIRADNVSFRYEDQPDTLLESVSFSLDEKARVGLIGDNGCGKTTLFAIMRGRLRPTSGSLAVRTDTTIGYLPQEVRLDETVTVRDYLWSARDRFGVIRRRLDSLEEHSSEYADLIGQFYAEGGGQFEAEMERVLGGFGLEDRFPAASVHTLSGGEKTKLALARLVLRGPDVLLLDEPTNHLEIASLEWLENYLINISVPFIVISHDRRFLDRCTNETWQLRTGRLEVFSGNYSFYRDQVEKQKQRQQEEYEQQQKKIDQLRAAAAQRKTESLSQENFKFNRSISKRGSVQKRDAGSGRGTVNPSKKMKAAKSLEKRIDRMMEKEEARKPIVEKQRKVLFKDSHLKNPVVLRIESLSKSFGSRRVLHRLGLAVNNGTRLGVIGRNGSGKSTLLKILTKNMEASDGSFAWAPQASVGYFSQEHETLNEKHSILDEVLQGRIQEQTQARIILGRLGIRREKVHQAVGSLSLGERSKTALAKVLFSEPDVLVLDEPTNHMELSSREAFEEALEEFDGTIILASHDRFLLERITTDVLDLDRGTLYPGGYAEYEKAQRDRNA